MAEATAEAKAPVKSGGAARTIKVTVAFPLGTKPYKASFAGESTVGSVRVAAMAHFGMSEEPGLETYLTHDGLRVPDTNTVREVSGHAAEVKFVLVRSIVQG